MLWQEKSVLFNEGRNPPAKNPPWTRYCDRTKPRLIELRRASDTRIKRHIKIRNDANPFDPAWEPYFEERIGFKMADNIKDRKRLLRLWLDQDGKCLVCEEKITKETGWSVHHLARRVDGGTNKLGNLVMLHPNCHCQVHSLGINVVKSASAMKLWKA